MTKNGAPEEKRGILEYLKSRLVLAEGKIRLEGADQVPYKSLSE